MSKIACQDLLIELLTEELPPTALKTLRDHFALAIKTELDHASLTHGDIVAYASPRRLAVTVSQLAQRQQDKVVERRGPALSAAFDKAGQATKALQGFARSCGVEIDQLSQQTTDKGTWLSFTQQQSGQETVTLLADILRNALATLPIAKRMRWGDSTEEFVRPVHRLVVLLGDKVVPMTILGVEAGNDSLGHRVHHPEVVQLDHASHYVEQLHQAFVMVDYEQRQQSIVEQVTAEATRLGGEAIIDPQLLDEVTGLVEWPVALSGRYDSDFLSLPSEVLISSMEGHQKYFAVQGEKGKLLPYFITVANINSRDPHQVIAGNERVILPRLSDAAFFWKMDRQQSLMSFSAHLDRVVFQKQLGTIQHKVIRVMALARWIAEQLSIPADTVVRAAQLAKCDLMTDMVNEFPKLEGIMGGYYAAEDKEDPAVCQAITEQYLPRYSGDSLPTTVTGQILSLADKLDTLVGLFGIGQPPTGVKDPFALRRATLGIVRILIEKALPLDLKAVITQATVILAENITETDCVESTLKYCFERLRGYITEQGYSADVIDAVFASNVTIPVDCMARIAAVSEFCQLTQAQSLAAANKRIGNLLRKNKVTLDNITIAPHLLQHHSEQALVTELERVTEVVAPAIAQQQYTVVLTTLACLNEPVDTFFNCVMVMDEDERIRQNRLIILHQIRTLFLQVADISYLSVGKVV